MLFLFFYIFFVYPWDKRIRAEEIKTEYSLKRETLIYDFIRNVKRARIQIANLSLAQKELKGYSFLNNSADYHLHPQNVHLSLGWFPLFAEHKNALYAPVNTVFEYNLFLPGETILEFDCGIISSINGVLQASAVFEIKIIDEKNEVHSVFKKEVKPLPPYRWRYSDSYYKNFYKYLKVNIENREGKWEPAALDLSPFAGQRIRIQFCTSNPENKLTHAFWANPRLYQIGDLANKQPHNFVLIVVDTLRSDHLGINGAPGTISPNIDSLAKKGVNFRQCFANGNMTEQSMSSFFTSRYPQELGKIAFEYHSSQETKNDFYQKKIPTLASILSNHGYLTKAIGCMSLLSDGIGFGVDWGFDDLTIVEQANYEQPQTTYAAIKWLKENYKKNFFLLLYYGGAHGPYRPPLRFLKQTYRSELANFKDWYKIFYRGEVAYTDYYIGKVLETLEQLKLTGTTLVILCSDHGDTFKEYLVEKKKSKKVGKSVFYDHGVSLTDDEIKVPLIFSLPGKIPESRTIQESVQLLDVVPTALEILGIEDKCFFQGCNLYPLLRREKNIHPKVIFTYGRNNYGIRVDDRYKYIYNFGTYSRKRERRLIDREELYNLKEDPLENNNLAGMNQERLLQMRKINESFIPLFEQNKLVFQNVLGSPIEGEIKISGKVKFGEKKSENNRLELSGSEIKFRFVSDDELTFETEPNNAEFTLDLKAVNRRIPLNEILVSGLGLPLLDGNTNKITRQDFAYLKGIGRISPHEKELTVFLGRLSKIVVSGGEQAFLPRELKTMLEEWGYINR